MAAKEAELEKLKEYKVYEEVNDQGQDILTTRWVMTMKQGKPKARLVVRGFEEEEVVQNDSPTVTRGAMRILFTIAASMPWLIKTTDIRSAFLQGNDLKRTVYVRPPKEARKEGLKTVWRLRKCL